MRSMSESRPGQHSIEKIGRTQADRQRTDGPFRPFVLIPTYNNAGTILQVIGDVRRHYKDLIVVNDGSTDETADLLAQSTVETATHTENRGKGAALLTGFARGRERGFTHAVTFDADGQHHAEEIPGLLAEAEQHPNALVLGTRDMVRAHAPAANEFAGRMSDFGLKVQTGLDIRDSQSGFRVYPLAVVEALKLKPRRFEFEIDVLVRGCWAGVTVRNVPISVTYLPSDQRVSHFRPWIDTLRVLRTHCRFLLRQVLPIPHRRLFARSQINWDSQSSESVRGALARARQMGIRGTWRHLVTERAAPIEIAAAIGLGVVIGTSPLYGLHTFIVLYLALRWHLNPLAAFLGSSISIPPVAPIIGFACIAIGSLITQQVWPEVSIHDIQPSLHGLRRLAILWAIGWPFVAAVTSILLGFFSYHAVTLLRGRNCAESTASR
jgi:uncharacterized protein (DUF2062 family)